MIEHGSIEVIAADGDNFSAPITPIFPLNVAQVVTQVRNRIGVTLGAKLSDIPEGFDEVPTGLKGRWNGNSSTGKSVEVRIWQTAD